MSAPSYSCVFTTSHEVADRSFRNTVSQLECAIIYTLFAFGFIFRLYVYRCKIAQILGACAYSALFEVV